NRGAASSPSMCLGIGGANPVVDMRNNVFYTTQTSSGPGEGYALALNYASVYSNLTSDYNDFYSETAQLVVVGGFENSPDGDRGLLSDWRTTSGKDAHSVSADPLFVSSSTNAHIG